VESTLHEQIIALYPELTTKDFVPPVHIVLRDDSDGNGPYIAEWTHPTLSRPDFGHKQEVNH
jgi:hypothetical protein